MDVETVGMIWMKPGNSTLNGGIRFGGRFGESNGTGNGGYLREEYRNGGDWRR
jgi:hypothetical protein